MNKKKKIDQLFREKTQQGNFDFDPKYWDDAQSMLPLKSGKTGTFSAMKWAGLTLLVAGLSTIIYLGLFAPASTAETPVFEPRNIDHITIIDDENERIESSNNIEKIVASQKIKNTEAALANHKKTVDPQKHRSISTLPLSGEKELGNETLAQSPVSRAQNETNSNENVATNESQNLVENQQLKELKNTAKEPHEKAAQSQLESNANQTLDKAVASNANQGATELPIQSESAEKQSFSSANAEEMAPQKGTTEEPENHSIANNEIDIDSEQPIAEEEINPDYGVKKSFSFGDNFNFSIGATYQYTLLSRTLSGSNPTYINFRDEYEIAQIQSSFGLEAIIGFKNWHLLTGVSQMSISENVDYPASYWSTEPVEMGYWNSFENWNYQVDSTWQVDSIYAGHWRTDTAWTSFTDSNFVSNVDTIAIEKPNEQFAKNNGSRTVKYTEVPVLIGRSFRINKMVLDVQTGVYFGFYTETIGAHYLSSDGSGNIQTMEQNQKIIYNAALRIGVRYPVSDHLSIGAFPTFRAQLNSALKTPGISQKYFGYGLTVGVFYQF